MMSSPGELYTNEIYMQNILRKFSFILLAFLLSSAQNASAQESISLYTGGMDKQDGYFPLYWDDDNGQLYMEISRLDEDFLYLTSMATGSGMNGPRLDRGQIANEYIARFERTGPGVKLILTNTGYRSTDKDNEMLRRSVEESFLTSTVGSFDVLAEEGNTVLINATSYFLNDVVDIRRRLRNAGQGTFRVSRDLSDIYLPRTKAFPENTEVEAAITFTSDNPGSGIRSHAPDGRSITYRLHHSLVKLPDDGFKPRKFDPRSGYLAVSFYDFSKSFDEDYVTRYAVRHRLIKKDPDANMSEPVEPIIYYLDQGIPEPYRTAFREGAEWYNGVFEAAGFIDAFQVRDMPEDMDPMDARYNVIQWVHRSTAGPSIGPTFRDPRTGEIIKAAVRMDSHRSLMNYNLFAGISPGLTASGINGAHEWISGLDTSVDAEEFAMARRRQHSAHEVGHTLGFAHNFIAESYGRASVMDYPAPTIRLRNGRIDLSEAYSPGPGAFDTLAVRWGYTQFPDGEEEDGLKAIMDDAVHRGLKHITAPLASAFSSYPEATMWTLAENPLQELKHAMEVRKFLIDRFDETALKDGEPMYKLSERFVPVYLHHRFMITAAVKYIGGMRFDYALKGDPLPPTSIVEAHAQREALDILLDILEPAELAVPERILSLMSPRPYGYATDNLSFQSDATPAFDQLGLAKTMTNIVISGILNVRRTARVVAFADRDKELPSLEDIIHEMIRRTWLADDDQDHPALQRVVRQILVDELISLASDRNAVAEARASAEWGLRNILAHISLQPETSLTVEAQNQFVADEIRRFLNRSTSETERSRPSAPPSVLPLGQES